MPVKKGKGCVADVMREWKSGALHSGKDGKVVKNKDQAVAIALSMCGAGKEQTKSYEEYANSLITKVKEEYGEDCACKNKKSKGSASYADCGCKNCRKRMPMAIGYPTPTFSEEDTKMALSQLRKIKADTSHLIMMMEQEMMQGRMPEIEAWMESKITLATDYMAAVHDYAMYGPGLEDESDEGDEDDGGDKGVEGGGGDGYSEKKLKDSYAKGLTKGEQDTAKDEAKKTQEKAKAGKGAKEVYEDWDSDKSYRDRKKESGEKMPKSKATEAYERMYGKKDSEDMGESGTESALQKKSKESGIPYGILKRVHERGMAAWQTGHRPGVSPQQWALGRVNSFVTGSGGARKADADLWKKAGK
jgi:hypothetical protein